MPQMYPLLWLNLFILFIALMITCVMKISFYMSYSTASSKGLVKSKPMIKFNWKW